jgi:hypothetical protein
LQHYLFLEIKSYKSYLQDMLQLCRGMATMTHMLLAATTDGCPLMSHPRILLTVGRVEFDPRSLHADVTDTYNWVRHKTQPIHGLTAKLLETLCS